MKKKKELKGIFRGNQKGFGFVKIENMENEIYVSRGDTKDAIDGDEVIVKLLENQSREDKNPEGKIVKELGIEITSDEKKPILLESCANKERMKIK